MSLPTAEAKRFVVLPDRGKLLVSTDLHGNGEDFRTLRARYLALRSREVAYWLLLGDLVHGPSPAAREEALDDYPDESWFIVEGVEALQREYPEVLLLLGNHDLGHVGGPHPGRFWPDEVAHLEGQLSPEQRQRLRQLFWRAPLLAAAPCGLLFAHGSPGLRLKGPGQLAGLDYENLGDEQAALVHESVTSYGQPSAVAREVLQRMSTGTGLELHLVVHGHDRAPRCYFVEGANQVQPVLFGALPSEKRFLEIDLAARYRSPADLREGCEIRKLYP